MEKIETITYDIKITVPSRVTRRDVIKNLKDNLDLNETWDGKYDDKITDDEAGEEYEQKLIMTTKIQ